jgi:superfamily II DNA/RNA helicase
MFHSFISSPFNFSPHSLILSMLSRYVPPKEHIVFQQTSGSMIVFCRLVALSITLLLAGRLPTAESFLSQHHHLRRLPHPDHPSSTIIIHSEKSPSAVSASQGPSSWLDDNNNNDATLCDQTFDELYNDILPTWLLDRLTACGYIHPTLIQKVALDTILRDREDAVIQAQTGSGKTLTFLIPILAKVDPTRAAVQALIVVPSRELGLQVGKVAKRLAVNAVTMEHDDSSSSSVEKEDNPDDIIAATTSNSTTSSNNNNKLTIMTVLQGSQNRRQRAWAWADPPQVIIGTPKELCDMVRLGGIKRYNSVKYLVVDEVDACLLNNAGTLTSKLSSTSLHELLSKHLSPSFNDGDDSSNAAADEDIANEFIQQQSRRGSKGSPPRPLSKTRQTIFCSATIPQHRHFMKQCVQNQWILSKTPKHVCLQSGEQLLPPTLNHAYMVAATSEMKLATLRRILQKITSSNNGTVAVKKKVLIFAQPQRPLEQMAEVVAKDLKGGLLWKEVYGSKELSEATAIVGVLRYEDSLSKRAAAVQSFTGEGVASLPLSSHEWKGYNRAGSSEKEDNKDDDVKLRVLFSSDLAARGLDIRDISHVIHLDLAPDADTYVHRSGRTGRFGASGQVISIITPEQEFVLNRVANKLFLEMECIARQKTKQS